MKAYIFDTETTGFKSPQIIQAAWGYVESPADCTIESGELRHYRPSKRIEPGAMATHHIIEEDLVDYPPSETFALPEDCEYLIGHNSDFDWEVAGKPNVKRICTLALSRKMYPTLDSHSLSAMIYHCFPPAEVRDLLRNAHNAWADITLCAKLLGHLIDNQDMFNRVTTWEDLWILSEGARIPEYMPFGKHRGLHLSRLPGDYVAWLRRQVDIDRYLLQGLDIHCPRRNGR